MNSELDNILKSKTNLDDYLREYGENSLFLYNYYIQNTSRILNNYYAYGGYLSISDKIKLIYKILNNKINYEILNYLLSDLINYYLDDKYTKEIDLLLNDLLKLDKDNKIDLRLIGIKNYIYQKDPLYILNKDFDEIDDIIINDNDMIIKILDLSINRNYQFTSKNSLFLEYRIFENIDILIYFINNCIYDDYVLGLITGFFDTLSRDEQYIIHEKITNEDLKDFLSNSLNFDNYDVNTIVNDSKIYLFVEDKKEIIIKLLEDLLKKGITQEVVLIVDRVDLDYINKAYKIYGENLKISPLMNQEHKKLFDGPWDFPYYSVNEIKSSEQTFDLYTKTVDDKKDLAGNIKSLSPLEKYIAAYILTTKFYPYTEEKDEFREYHVSRSIYEFIDKVTNRKIVCVGYVHLLREFLFRMGLYDTIRWDVHSKDEEEKNNNPGDNHARMLVHLVDPKYQIDGVYMSDPTWDEMGLFQTKIKHMLMSKNEIRQVDPDFTDLDLHLDKIDEIGTELGVDNINELFNKPIPSDTIIKAFLAVFHFLDKNMKMTDNYSNSEYHDMAIKLGYESKYDDSYMPSFNDMLIMRRDELNTYFEIYPDLKFNFLTDLRIDLRKYFKGYNIELPIRITSNGIIVDLDINTPYLKYLEDCGYHIRYTKDKACIDIYSYSDEPLIWQYKKIIDKLVEFNGVVYNISRESENKGLK